jgi:hypothetical protein
MRPRINRRPRNPISPKHSFKPRNPAPGISIPGRDKIERDYSLTEEQDFQINVKPYIREMYVVETLGEHRHGNFIITGWKISQDVFGAN